jgi:hypothetical protein
MCASPPPNCFDLEERRETMPKQQHTEEIQTLKMQRIETLLEQALLDTALAVLYTLSEKQKRLRESICFKTDCPMRDDILF